jgi:hypothetical protein
MSWKLEGRARLVMLTSFLAGIGVGYLPIAAHLLFVRGYFSKLWDSVTHELLTGNTNIPLPIPWPWLVSAQGLAWPDATLRVGSGILFVLVPLTYAIGVAVLVRRFDARDPAHRLILAAASVGIPYLHHAFSRADTVHMLEGSQAFIPMIVGLTAVAMPEDASNRVGMRAMLSLCLVVAFLAFNELHQPRFRFERAAPRSYTKIDANGSRILVPRSTAAVVSALRKIKASYLAAGETLLVAPHWPMAYALLRLRAPIWEVYHLFPRSESFQRTEIEALERQRVEFAIFSEATIDGRTDMNMSVLTPLLYRYLMDNYAPIGSPVPFQLYRRKTPFPLSARSDVGKVRTPGSLETPSDHEVGDIQTQTIRY